MDALYPADRWTTEVVALYRSMNDKELRCYVTEFTHDRDQLTRDWPVARAQRLRGFCQSRIDLITQILDERRPK